jgi:hypothetical protein
MTERIWEHVWPYVAALLVTGAWAYFGMPFPKNLDPLMGASGTVASVLVGFLGTAKAIILSITSSKVFKRLKEAGYSDVLFQYLYEALLAGIVFLVISMVGFFLPESTAHPSNIQMCFSTIWILSGTGAIILYARTTSLLFKLVRQA